jgi:hypothetical protein
VVGIHDQHGVQRFLRKSGIVDLAANNLDVFQPLVLNEARQLVQGTVADVYGEHTATRSDFL